jgi:hypothetical protein
MEPMTLSPGLAARELIQDLLGQLLMSLPWFSSRRVNAGLDEPWELGDDRVSEWADWLAWLRSLRLRDGRELLIWGDVPATVPSASATTPQAPAQLPVVTVEADAHDGPPPRGHMGTLSDRFQGKRVIVGGSDKE